MRKQFLFFVTLLIVIRLILNQNSLAMYNVRKVAGYVLVGLIIFFTVIALLGIWDVIDIKEYITKALSSLLVIFIASAVVLFITSILIKDDSITRKD